MTSYRGGTSAISFGYKRQSALDRLPGRDRGRLHQPGVQRPEGFPGSRELRDLRQRERREEVFRM